MKGKTVIRWTCWEDPSFRDIDDRHYGLYCDAVENAIRKDGLCFSGEYHQNGGFGVPVFDDGAHFHVSERMWAKIMARAHGETGEKDYLKYYLHGGLAENGMNEVLPEGGNDA